MRQLVLVLVVVLGHASARAQAPQPQTRVESYRTTAAIIDGIGIALAIPGFVGIIEAEGGTRTLSIVAASLGVLTWLSGSPNLHRAKHADKSRMYLSAAIRILVPTLGIGVAAELATRRCPENETCRALELAVLGSAGASMLAASALDIGFLAEREIVVVPASGGVTVGLGSRF